MIRKMIKVALFLTVVMSYAVYAAPIQNLYSDQRAMKVDDLLTILIVESAKAGSESKTETSKQNEVERRKRNRCSQFYSECGDVWRDEGRV